LARVVVSLEDGALPAPHPYQRRIVPGILSSHATWRLDVARRVAAADPGNPKVTATAAVGGFGRQQLRPHQIIGRAHPSVIGVPRSAKSTVSTSS
jgi:hypothetical protein